MYIETKRLILRNYTMEDLDDYWKYVSSENVGPRCGWSPYTSLEDAKERLAYECTRPYQYAIVDKETNRVIGSIEIMDIKNNDYHNERGKEIGCLLSEEYWGRGIMTEAMTNIIKYCFEYLNLEEVIAGYFEPNIGSKRVQEKAGLKPYGRQKDYITWYLTGELCDCIMSKITKEEYENNSMYKNLEICVREGRRR